MTIIFVVTKGSYSDYGICDVFSTKDKAVEYIMNRHREDQRREQRWIKQYKTDLATLSDAENKKKHNTLLPFKSMESIEHDETANIVELMNKQIKRSQRSIADSQYLIDIKSIADYNIEEYELDKMEEG